MHHLARDWADYVGLHWRDLGSWVTAVLVLAAVATVVLARQTVTESQKASAKLAKVVAGLGELVDAIGVSTQAAKDAAAETRNATEAARQGVAEIRNVVAASKETAAASAEAATAIRQTIEILAAAREDDRRYRQLEQLRMIAALVADIEQTMYQASRGNSQITPVGPTWRAPQQHLLGSALVHVDPPLPKCLELVGANGLSDVQNKVLAAQAELHNVFSSLGTQPA